MKKSYLKGFKECRFMDYADTRTKAEKRIPSEGDIQKIRDNLLKRECIETIKDNEITVSTETDSITIWFFKDSILILEQENAHTCWANKERIYKKAY